MSKLLKLLTFISPKFLDLFSDFILIESSESLEEVVVSNKNKISS